MAVSHGTYTIVDVMDGELGVNTATIYLYKRSSSTPTVLPAGNVKYKFSEHRITEGTLNGWVEDISELSVTGDPIYMIMATASAPSNEDEDIIDTEEWAGPIEIAKEGTSITQVIPIYQLKTTSGIPSKPADGVIITSESTGPNEWTKAIPVYVSGAVYYTSMQVFFSSGTSPISTNVVEDRALTNANANAKTAKDLAEELQADLKFIWTNLTDTYPPGTYMASGKSGQAFIRSDSSTYGFNSFINNQALNFRYDGINLTSIGIEGIQLNVPTIEEQSITGSTIGAVINTDGMQIYRADDLNPIASYGTIINLYRPGTRESVISIDAEHGLNIVGAITATSLLISDGSEEYDGIDAISMSGYHLEIEKESIDSETEVNLYAILYYNGEEVDDAATTSFIWFKDNDSEHVEGYGNTLVGLYGHKYKVVYEAFGRKISQAINLEIPAEPITKYVSNIDGNGITVHAVNNKESNYIQIDTNGLEIYKNQNSIAKFGELMRIGEDKSFHIEITNEELGFWNGTNSVEDNKIAYLNGHQLYITQSVVLNQMDVGSPINPETLTGGQWSWKVHKNEQGTNNLYLKWIG